MSNKFKSMYRDSLVCPLIITSSAGKILYKNIAADKILSFIRKGANIFRYIGDESPDKYLSAISGDMPVLLKISSYAETEYEFEAISASYPLDGAERVCCHLFKPTYAMLSQESGHMTDALLSRCLPLFHKSMRDIISTPDEQDSGEIRRFIKNNCVRIYHMDRILSGYYKQLHTPQIPVRGVYEVRAMLRDLRDHLSDTSIYLGYRISYSIDDCPFLIYAEAKHFYAMMIFAYSIIYRFSADGKINVSYKAQAAQSGAGISMSAQYGSGREHNRTDHNFTEVDLSAAGVFAELCGCEISVRTDGSLLELDIRLAQSDKIKGLLRSTPDIMYTCGLKQ